MFGDRDRGGGFKTYRTLESGELVPKVVLGKLGLLLEGKELGP